MIKRLASILFALGFLQGGNDLAADDLVVVDESAENRIRVVDEAGARTSSRTAEAGASRHLGEGEILLVAGGHGSRVSAALITPVAAHVASITLQAEGGGWSAPDHLLDAAFDRCRDAGCLKVIVESRADPRSIRSAAERRGFQFSGQAQSDDGFALTLYTDLYFVAAPRQVRLS